MYSLYKQNGIQRLLNGCALLSLISVSVNTPKTFDIYPNLVYITLICDLTVTLIFSVEMIYKMYAFGMWRVSNIFDDITNFYNYFECTSNKNLFNRESTRI